MKRDINQENLNEMLMKSPQRVCEAVGQINALCSKIKWKTVSFTIMHEPKPSQRPRLCGHRVYVPGAAKNAAWFNKHVYPTLRDVFITTPCRMDIDVYVKTPTSYTKSQTILAEKKILRPWAATGDIDNYAKSSMDQIQPNKKRKHHGILIDDCLVTNINATKYYSITPRYEITITYMDSIPKQLIHILKLDKITKMIEEGDYE